MRTPRRMIPFGVFLLTVLCASLLFAQRDEATATGTVSAPSAQGEGTGNQAPLSPFGVSSDSVNFYTFSDWAPLMSAAGVIWMRGTPEFTTIEPTEGTWYWTDLDNELKIAAANHMEVSGGFWYDASWINSDTHTFPTADLPAWSTYVSTLVKHVAGKVKWWEIWNEAPNFCDNTCGPDAYAAVVETAYDAAHAAGPTTHVALAVSSVNVNYLDRTLLAGAVDYFDLITVHPYEILSTLDTGTGWEGDFMSIVPTIRKMLAARDPSRLNVPIWITEIGEAVGSLDATGPTGTDTVTEEIQAGDLVKVYSMGIAEGMSVVDWFESEDGCCGAMGLLDRQGKPRLAYTAMSQMTQYLGESPSYLGWVLLNGQDYGFVFQGASTTIMATWAPPGIEDTVIFPQTVQVVDPTTGHSEERQAYSLTNIPILVVGVPQPLVAQAMTNRSLPFPWEGDYTNATEVSLTAGFSANPAHLFFEKGLHYDVPYPPASLVNLNGVLAVNASNTVEEYFEVDPNFLSYRTVPITITAVVRSDDTTNSAGFNLEYESTAGENTMEPWTPVPGDSKWHTITWTITDDQFVSMWGYNFQFDSQGAAQSNYYIQSVTVTKE